MQNDNLTYSIIPARGGSKGVPGKNVRLLNDLPLIAYSIKISLKSNFISRTIVSTDSEEIAEIARRYGAEVPFLRPAELARDNSTDLEFVQHALSWFQENDGVVPDYLVHLRPTTPLREIDVVDAAIEYFLSQSQATALRSVHEMSESAYKTFEIDDGILKTVFTRSNELDSSNEARQHYPKTYSANGYVDILKSKFVIENNKIHGSKVVPFITPRVTEVDTLDDFELLQFEISKNRKILEQFS